MYKKFFNVYSQILCFDSKFSHLINDKIAKKYVGLNILNLRLSLLNVAALYSFTLKLWV